MVMKLMGRVLGMKPCGHGEKWRGEEHEKAIGTPCGYHGSSSG